MSAELPWRYRIAPACWEWPRFDAGWAGGGVRGLRTVISWQHGRCAICGAALGTGLQVDSDPGGQSVRGLLCESCTGAEARSDAKVFRSYRRLHPARLLGLTISPQVLATGFWRHWRTHLLRTSGSADLLPDSAAGDSPTVRSGFRRSFGWQRSRRAGRLVVDSYRPDRFRAALERDAPDPEQTDRMRIALHQALEDVERYASMMEDRPNGQVDS